MNQAGDNPRLLCQDCSRPLFRWFLSRIDWRRILKQTTRRNAGVPVPGGQSTPPKDADGQAR